MNYLLYLLGFLPSFVWLLFYLRKDKHPEPNRTVIKVFFLGIASAFATIFLQLILGYALGYLIKSEFVILTLNIFIGAGFIEEITKYLAVRLGVYRDKELDEPTDLVLYMIISALGFAALENILYIDKHLLSPENLAIMSNYHVLLPAKETLEFMGWRFISATFLHALCSGLIGYFLALSFYYSKRKKPLVALGIIIAALLHGAYDWFIIITGTTQTNLGIASLLVPLTILITLSCFISYSFKKLRKMQSKCI